MLFVCLFVFVVILCLWTHWVEWLTQYVFFYINRIFDSASYLASTGFLWEAIAQQKPTFTCKLSWLSKAGKPVHTMTTHWIKYRQGLPVNLVMFVQPIPEMLVSTPTLNVVAPPTYREDNKMVLPSMPFVASAPATRPRSILASLASSISTQPKQYATLVVPSPQSQSQNQSQSQTQSQTQFSFEQSNDVLLSPNIESFKDDMFSSLNLSQIPVLSFFD